MLPSRLHEKVGCVLLQVISSIYNEYIVQHPQIDVAMAMYTSLQLGKVLREDSTHIGAM